MTEGYLVLASSKTRVLAEVKPYSRSPWGSQKYFVQFYDPRTQEETVCGHAHSTTQLALRCARRMLDDEIW